MRKLTIREIQIETAKYFNLDLNVLLGKTRKQYAVRARHIAMYLCREYTGNSFPMIAAHTGDKDHATAIYAHKKISKQINFDKFLKSEVKDVTGRIEKLVTENGYRTNRKFAPFWKTIIKKHRKGE